jgi:uncharacterized protein
MNRSGHADLPLHYGNVPPWLAKRMSLLGGAIVEAIVSEYGKSEVLRRMSDPLWFQALGCVLGMDWHSSGITTSVMGALKKSINPISHDLGIYICGGKGKFSRETPNELMRIADHTGMNGTALVRASKLSAKIDNTAIQDGYQLYLHSFVVSDQGEWAVVQQGMNDANGMARRYHWHSGSLKSFINEPHTSIYGKNQGMILNLVDKDATPTQDGILKVAHEEACKMQIELRNILMPRHHDVRKEDVNIKRLGTVIALAQERETRNFEDLLLLEGLGPRTLQSLTLVSEVIHGTPSRFEDPARFSFAHGGKDGHPFPVPTKVYDETISTLKNAVEKAKIGFTDKQKAIKSLHTLAVSMEYDFIPNDNFDELIEKERAESYKYGGRTVFGKAQPPKNSTRQLDLFQGDRG